MRGAHIAQNGKTGIQRILCILERIISSLHSGLLVIDTRIIAGQRQVHVHVDESRENKSAIFINNRFTFKGTLSAFINPLDSLSIR